MLDSLKKPILTPEQVEQKIRRIAFEVYENNFDETGLVLAGVEGQGYRFATRLADYLRSISALEVELVQLSIDKAVPNLRPITFDYPPEALQGRCIIICDDVLYTGRTLAYCLSPFFRIIPKKLQVAVIVDRNYRRYPISADYVGYALSTTLTEHVEVVLEGEGAGVFLS
ncbi:MAG: phosphoribosyltransferase [Cytophagaceae bacterium]|nr:phosphoribosyltransferase [Cytophagaceae bacterium]